MTAAQEKAGVVAPRVERRHWHGPKDYYTTHWVVVLADGELLNGKRRIKKFRSAATAIAAAAKIAKAVQP